jgi:hypothetical protein
MIGRLLSTKEQVCKSDDFYSIRVEQGLEITLHDSVILDSDVLMLMDASPTTWSNTGDGKIGSYVFEQIQAGPDGTVDPTGLEFEISFLFEQSDNDFVLSGVETSDIPMEILGSAVSMMNESTEMVQTVCETRINPFARSVKLNIDRDTLDLLPARELVVSWLGGAIEASGKNNGLIYEFRLKGDQENQPVARINAQYEPLADYPKLIDASYTHYQANIDVPAATLHVKLHF